jgi:nucleotide-binding universal stress UspA family protein
MYPFRKILVATDFEAASAGALDLGSGLAYEYEAQLVIAHAIEIMIPSYPIAVMPEVSDFERQAKAELDAIVNRVQAVWPLVTGTLLWGNPAEEVVRYAEDEKMDLVVVGTHGRKGPSRWLIGSVAERVTRAAHVPVLTVHEGDDRLPMKEVGASPT